VREVDESVDERNYAKKPLTAEEIGELVDLAGGVAAVLSTRNAAVKERGWAASPPDKATFVAAAAADNNLLRRPILVVGDRVVVGKDAAAIREALES
jgi:arsenate reductase-like glutaredoxin family protein